MRKCVDCINYKRNFVVYTLRESFQVQFLGFARVWGVFMKRTIKNPRPEFIKPRVICMTGRTQAFEYCSKASTSHCPRVYCNRPFGDFLEFHNRFAPSTPVVTCQPDKSPSSLRALSTFQNLSRVIVGANTTTVRVFFSFRNPLIFSSKERSSALNESIHESTTQMLAALAILWTDWFLFVRNSLQNTR